MPFWLVGALSWTILVGAMGVTAKVALRKGTWQLLLRATTATYIVAAMSTVATGVVAVPPLAGWILAVVVTGACSAVAMWMMFIALERADASQVVPLTACYPIVTVVLSVVALKEPIGVTAVFGIVVIVVGVALVAR